MGSKLPSTRELERTYGASRNTVQGALRQLEAQGLIQCEPRKVARIRARTATIKSLSHMRATQICMIPGFLLYTHHAGEWQQRISNAAAAEFNRAGYQVMTFLDFAGSSNKDQSLPKIPSGQSLLSRLQLLGDSLAGVIQFNPSPRDPIDEQLNQWGIPWVSINRSVDKQRHNFVTAENSRGGEYLGKYIGRIGCERVVYLSVPLTASSTTTEVFSGFVSGYVSVGRQLAGVSYLVCPDWIENCGYERTRKFLETHQVPQVIVAGGDHLAIGAMCALREQGLDIPSQVGVVGCTGVTHATTCHPRLTVLAQPMEQMGQRAAEMLLQMIREGTEPVQGQFVPSRIIFRESLLVRDDIRRELQEEFDLGVAD